MARFNKDKLYKSATPLKMIRVKCPAINKDAGLAGDLIYISPC